MADILTPKQVDAIRERLDQPQNYDEGSMLRYLALERSADDVLALLADHDALTAEVERLRETLVIANDTAEREHDRREAAERKVAAVRIVVTGPITGEATTAQWFDTIRALLDGEAD